MATVNPTESSPRLAAERGGLRHEIIAVLLLAFSVSLLLCLVSYHPNDPSWNAAGQAETRNWVGRIGANIAVTMLQWLGLVAYLLPPLMLVVAWRFFRDSVIRAPYLRVIGLGLITLATAALVSISSIGDALQSFVSWMFDSSFKAGGLIGYALASLTQHILGAPGSIILLTALIAIGFLLATNFSLISTYDNLSENAPTTREILVNFFNGLRARWQAWREQRQATINALRQAREATQLDAKKAIREARATRKTNAALTTESELPDEADEFQRESNLNAAAAIRRSAGSSDVPFEELVADEAEMEAEFAPVIRGANMTEDFSPRTLAPDEILAGAGIAARMAHAEAREADAVREMLETAEVVRSEFDDDGNLSNGVDGGHTPPPAPKKKKPVLLDYTLPETPFLNEAPPRREQADEELLEVAQRIAEKCQEFNVTGRIEHICPGPVVTTYEFKPAPGVKYSRITGLVDDLSLALKAESVRIDRIPGKPHVGIEVPNPNRETIYLREVIESKKFLESNSKLTVALGKTIDGLNYVADLAKMPHLLIAGATGAGKSVGVNTLVVSILYKASPDEVKFIMVDPKRLELGLYADIPHLATPIITEPKRASFALKWAVGEMERRYKELAGWGVRNIDGFNAEVVRRNSIADYDENDEAHKTLPYIVIIVDELADLMMTSGHEVEESITRLAQMARAVGIHLVLATQRPSVDVITGLIKANFPSRISFRVSSKIDSRTIIDGNGAEALLGRGDMLFLPPGTSRLVRVHGAYIDEQEISKIVEHIKAQSAPQYNETITQSEDEVLGLEDAGERDPLFEEALRLCVEQKKASTSWLQRRLRIGYGRAAAILDSMERQGLIGPADGSRPRAILPRGYELISDWNEQAASQ